MPSTVSAIAWSWRVDTVCRSDGIGGDRCLKSFDGVWIYVVPMREVKMDVCSPIGVHASCEPVESRIMSMFCGQRNQ